MFSHNDYYYDFYTLDITFVSVYTFITASVISRPHITTLSRNECLVTFTVLVSKINK